MNTVSHKYRQSALLLLTAAIWGSAFVAQKTGMDYVGPFTFNAARNLLGGLTLLPSVVFFSSCKKRTLPPDASSENVTQQKTLWAGGILCGIALFVASTLQQVGIRIQPSERPVLSPHFISYLFRSAVFFSESVYSRRSGSQFLLPSLVSICSV